jgi:glycosyltransferase involved in cell wall biosynthesis
VTADYVDLPLLAEAARARPDWSWVLLGDVRCDTSAIAGVQNVHVLGGRPYNELPAYCRGFDVGLIPFRMNRLTRAVNPIKLREYLAAGLPVVSAPMEEVLRYAPAVQTAQTLDTFLAACAEALTQAADGRSAARQALVRDESWDARVEGLSRIVMEVPETGSVPAHTRTSPSAKRREEALLTAR